MLSQQEAEEIGRQIGLILLKYKNFIVFLGSGYAA